MKKKDTEEKSKKTIKFPAGGRKSHYKKSAKGYVPYYGRSGEYADSAEAGSGGDYNGEEVSNKDSDSAIRKRSTYRRATLGSLLALIFLIFYIPSLFTWLSGNNPVQDVIRNGVIEEYVSVEAVIVREEELLEPSTIDGRYIAEIKEGEKAAAFSRIAIVTGTESDKLLQDLEDINAKIVKARMEQVEKADFFSADLAKLDEEIGAKVQDLILACNSKSFAEMGRQRTEIRRIVEKKAEIVAANSTDGYINSLQQQKESIQSKINSNTSNVRTSISGIVSYRIDGYENILTPNAIEELTAEKLDVIRKQSAAIPVETGKVKAGSPYAKIIKGIDIYLIADIPAEKADKFEKGKSIRLRINSAELESTGSITYAGKDKNGSMIVAVKINRGADLLSAERIADVDLITKTEEGLKVPLKCIRDITPDGKRGRIVLVRYNVAANRIVDILCSDDEYAIIRTPEDEYEKTVNLYNIYIINPDNIEEGDIIRK